MPPNGVACILVPSKPVQFFPPRLRISMGTRMAHHAILMSRPAQGSVMQNAAKTPRILWSAVIFLAFIGVTAVSHRALALLYPATFTGKFPPARALDDLFTAHRSLTLVHIIPGFSSWFSARCNSPKTFARAIRAFIAGPAAFLSFPASSSALPLSG